MSEPVDDPARQLQNRLLFAVPKKGRLFETCSKLLEQIDIKYRRKNRLDIALATNFDLALVFLPAADIALYVAEGRVDLGITGRDMVQESNVDVQELLQLGFGKCKLCVQAPIKSNIKNPKDLCGKRIVTSFPTLAAKYFKELDPTKTTSIHYVSGSVEAACALGLADGIVDLVETGDTMRAAGLEVVSEIMTTEALLVANPHTAHKELVDTFRKRIAGALTAERHVMIEYNVERARLAEAVKITPGKKSPTLSPLDDANWVAVKCLILLSESNTKMDQLEKIGARDILIYNIHNCRVSNE